MEQESINQHERLQDCASASSPSVPSAQANTPVHSGSLTKALFARYMSTGPIVPKEAFHELAAGIVPFSERLLHYLAIRFCVEPDAAQVKRALREAAEEKGIPLSSANLSQWISSSRGEVYLSQQSIFKLCLLAELTLEQSATFIYDCLYRGWFNCRDAKDAAYLFFLSQQELFGNDTYAQAERYLETLKAMRVTEPCEGGDATGFTQAIREALDDIMVAEYGTTDQAIAALDEFFARNAGRFTGCQRTAIRTYTTYLSEGGVGLRPLTELYKEATGSTLPVSSYLDMSNTGRDSHRKRLLWGSAERRRWIAENGQDWDVLNDREIKLEHHAVENMQRTGILRGNMLALVFFHFCLENRQEFSNAGGREELFARFYRIADRILVDECGMTPLHPRKQFDRLFLSSVALCGQMDPITYLNRLLERFYAG